jgi:hypothetical protein
MTQMAKDRKMPCKSEFPALLFAIALAVVLFSFGASGLVAESGGPEGQGATAATPGKKSAKKSPKASTPSMEADKKGATPSLQGPKTPPIVGRRDPFKLPGPPVQDAEGSGEVPIGNLPPGTRGLVISRLRLEGIVRLDTTSTLIAIVDTNANRAYFLRESDAVYNGVVAKITPDSVTFRENTLDSAGKVGTRDVVLRLTQGPGA